MTSARRPGSEYEGNRAVREGDWNLVAQGPGQKERHEHSAYVLWDKVWVAGGHDQPLSSEVWSLQVPRDWFEVRPEEKSGMRLADEATPGGKR